MTPTLFYFLQVIVCSAILFGYYLLVLRDKKFHQYNRFYLLFVLIAPWIIPLIRLPLKIGSAVGNYQSAPLKVFEVIADQNTHFEEYVSQTTPTMINWSNVFAIAYFSVCSLMLLAFLISIIRILLLVKKHSLQKKDGTLLVLTNINGTPFSFFRFIFWNEAIDINSSVGQQILQHEITHVKEKHSLDKLICCFVLSLGWFNPVFWFVRKELDMVHEFIADNKAVNNDAAELARMLLITSLPSSHYLLTNTFFHSPIKRRLFMMNKFEVAKHPYLRRVVIVPLLFIVILLFSFRRNVSGLINIKPTNEAVKINTEKIPGNASDAPVLSTVTKPFELSKAGNINVELSREFIVMLDAGHGGYDEGATATDGTKESDISLELVKTIVEENNNENIKLVLTRESDIYQSPIVKVELTKQSKADVLVSMHVETSTNKDEKGIDLYIPGQDTLSNYKTSYQLANVLANTFSDNQLTVRIKKRQVGIWIINKAERPAVLIEAGFLSNKEDLKKVKNKNYQRKLARVILNGIERYLAELDKGH